MYFRALSNSTNTMSLNRGAAIQPGTYRSQAVFSNSGDVFSNSQKAEQAASKPAVKFSGWDSLIKLFAAMNTGAAAGKTCRDFMDRHYQPPKKHSSRRHKPRYEEYDVYDRRTGRYLYTKRRRIY